MPAHPLEFEGGALRKMANEWGIHSNTACPRRSPLTGSEGLCFDDGPSLFLMKTYPTRREKMRTRRMERIGMVMTGLLLGGGLAVPSTVHAAPTIP